LRCRGRWLGTWWAFRCGPHHVGGGELPQGGALHRRRSQRQVWRSASADAAERRHGVSSVTATRCQRVQDGQRACCSARSGLILMREPQKLHRVFRRGSPLSSRMTCASSGPLVRANGRPRMCNLSIVSRAYGGVGQSCNAFAGPDRACSCDGGDMR